MKAIIGLILTLPVSLGAGTTTRVEGIKGMIAREASRQGLQPEVAIAIATIESQLNPKAVGGLGEIGLFQVRPEFSPVSRRELFDVATNIRVGVSKLVYTRKRCKHNVDLTWVTCYNHGINKHPRYPKKLKYYRKFKEALHVNG